MKVYTDKSWITDELDDLSYLHFFDYKRFDFVNKLEDANILLQTDFNHPMNISYKKVLICMEPRTPRFYSNYNVVLTTHKNYPDFETNRNRYIYYPFMFYYLNTHKYIHYVLNRNLYFKPENKKKFCIFINSNNNAWQRLDFCKRLMEYKKVDCYAGPYKNCETFHHRYWTPEFLNLIRQYKFIICFENSDVDGYITEKLANAYLSDTIPIYWGNQNAQKFINKNCIVSLVDYDEENINKALTEIKELDQNDELYFSKIKEPLFLNNEIPKEFDLKKIRDEIYEKLRI